MQTDAAAPTTMGAVNRKALTFWQQVIAESITPQEVDLSNRQMALLLHVYLHSGPHTIKTLAASLNISKPAICRAVDCLSCLGWVKRRRDTDDKRIVYVEKTPEGAEYLAGFSRTITRSLTAFS